MPTFLIAFIIPMAIGLWAQHRVKSTFARNLQVPASHGMTGAEVARRILDSNGLNEVPIEETPGQLSDHYDPRSRSVHLSPEVYGGRSISSTAVGSHEVGHALQHAKSYSFFKFRSALAPAVQFTSNIWLLFLIGGIFLEHPRLHLHRGRALLGRGAVHARHAARRVRRVEACKGAVERSRARSGERERGREERSLGCGLDVRRRRSGGGGDAPLLPVAALQPIAGERLVTVTFRVTVTVPFIVRAASS